MQKSTEMIKPTTVPEDGWTEYRVGGSRRRTKTFKKVPFGRCIRQQEQQEKKQQHQHERRDCRDEERIAEDPNSGGGLPGTAVYSDSDGIVGHELVRQYYTVLYNAPEHVWRFYAERARYCHVNANGMRIVATGRSQLRRLFETTAENGHISGHNRRQVVVESVNTVRYGPDQLLVMATSEQFVQSFAVEFKPPRSYTVVASIVQHAFTARPPPAKGDRGTRTGRDAVGCPFSADRQLFVGHLSSSTTAEHLRKTFAEFGEVAHVRIMDGYNRSGQTAKYNYAFVVFRELGGVDAALASRPIELCNGNRVNVHRSKESGRRLFPKT